MADIDCVEEQQLEVEALESILVGEIEIINEEPYTYEVIIKADRDNDDDNFVTVKLKVEYPEEYPNVTPKFQLKNLSPINLLIGEFNNCHKIFKDTAEEMMGEQMIFQCIENIREFLQEKNDVFVEEKHKVEEEEKIKEENMGKKYIAEKRLDFIPVNKDTFSVWLEKFMKERAILKEEEYMNRSKDQIEKDSRKSGRDHFIQKQGMVGSNITFEEDEIDKIIEEHGEDALEVVEESTEDQQKEFFDEDLYDDENLDDLGK
jgi:hypothetical protein